MNPNQDPSASMWLRHFDGDQHITHTYLAATSSQASMWLRHFDGDQRWRKENNV